MSYGYVSPRILDKSIHDFTRILYIIPVQYTNAVIDLVGNEKVIVSHYLYFVTVVLQLPKK